MMWKFWTVSDEYYKRIAKQNKERSSIRLH